MVFGGGEEVSGAMTPEQRDAYNRRRRERYANATPEEVAERKRKRREVYENNPEQVERDRAARRRWYHKNRAEMSAEEIEDYNQKRRIPREQWKQRAKKPPMTAAERAEYNRLRREKYKTAPKRPPKQMTVEERAEYNRLRRERYVPVARRPAQSREERNRLRRGRYVKTDRKPPMSREEYNRLQREKYERVRKEFVTGFLEAQDHKCNGCGCDLKADPNTHIDHIVPRSKGGGDDRDNLQALCAYCNLLKAENSMEWLLEELETYDHSMKEYTNPNVLRSQAPLLYRN